MEQKVKTVDGMLQKIDTLITEVKPVGVTKSPGMQKNSETKKCCTCKC